MNNVKITLGMPVLNGEKHIRFALNSIFKQSFKNFNLIISDNASSDKTFSICNEYKKKHKNIKIYKQKKRISGIDNWISLLEKTKSKYFLFCAHDDYFKEKDYLKKLINKISYNTIPISSVKIIDHNNNIIKHLSNDRVLNYKGPSIYRRLKFFITPSLIGKNRILYGIQERNHVLKILKIFQKIEYTKNYFYNYLDYVDNYMHYEILKKKKIVTVNTTTLYKRIKKHEEKVNLLGSKKNKFRLMLNQLQILWTYTRFSNFLEIVIITLLIPVYILNERILLLIFKIKNKFNV